MIVEAGYFEEDMVFLNRSQCCKVEREGEAEGWKLHRGSLGEALRFWLLFQNFVG
jgi:hypothetical protein